MPSSVEVSNHIRQRITNKTEINSISPSDVGGTMEEVLIYAKDRADELISGIMVAVPSSNPGSPPQSTIWMAKEAGTYTNFGSIVVDTEDVTGENTTYLLWDGSSWSKQVKSLGTNAINTGDLTSPSTYPQALIGYRLNPSDYSKLADPDYVLLDDYYINVRKSLKIRKGAGSSASLRFFNSGGSPIAGFGVGSGAGTFDVFPIPAGTAFIRMNISTSPGSRDTDMAAFAIIEQDYFTGEITEKRVMTASDVRDLQIIDLKQEEAKKTYIEYTDSLNIVDEGLLSWGNYITGTGVISSGASQPRDYHVMGIIDLDPGETHISFLRRGTGSTLGWFIDEDNTLISAAGGLGSVASGTIEIPAGAVAFIFNASAREFIADRKLDINYLTIVYGETIPSFPIGKKQVISANNTPVIRSKWAGKKLVATGDSITEYADTGSAHILEDNYINQLTAMTGMQLVANYALGGSTISESVAEPEERDPISVRYTEMEDDADLVIVAAGTNDCTYAWTPLGTKSDNTINTFYGALNILMSGLKAKYPGKVIVFVTPLKRYATVTGMTTPDTPNANGDLPIEFVDAIIERAGYYGIAVYDRYRLEQGNPFFASDRSTWIIDGTHPTPAFHTLMAERLTAFLNTL